MALLSQSARSLIVVTKVAANYFLKIYTKVQLLRLASCQDMGKNVHCSYLRDEKKKLFPNFIYKDIPMHNNVLEHW